MQAGILLVKLSSGSEELGMAPSLEHGVDEGSGKARVRRTRFKREHRAPKLALRVLVVED